MPPGKVSDPEQKRALTRWAQGLTTQVEQMAFPQVTPGRSRGIQALLRARGYPPLGAVSLTTAEPIPCSVRLTQRGLTLVTTTAPGAMALSVLLSWRVPEGQLTTCDACGTPMLESAFHRRYCSLRCKWRAKQRRHRTGQAD